jgi:hypothetical protein
MDDRRKVKDRRVDKDRRKDDSSSYSGPEKRKMEYRRILSRRLTQ